MIKIIVALGASLGIFQFIKQIVIFIKILVDHSYVGIADFYSNWKQLQTWNPVWLVILSAIIFLILAYYLLKTKTSTKFLSFSTNNPLYINFTYVFGILGGIYVLSFGLGYIVGMFASLTSK